MRYTPLRDLLRGRVSGRLDWRSQITSAAVAPEVKTLVSTVVCRTRLRSVEKVDVAAELLDHFFDGLDAGSTNAALIDAFGDPRQAAPSGLEWAYTTAQAQPFVPRPLLSSFAPSAWDPLRAVGV